MGVSMESEANGRNTMVFYSIIWPHDETMNITRMFMFVDS